MEEPKAQRFVPWTLRASVLFVVILLMVAGVSLVVPTVAGYGGAASAAKPTTSPPETPAATPTIATAAAQHGAVIVTLGDANAGAALYYTIDGSAPTRSSPKYEAPFLVASNLTLKAIAAAPSLLDSSIATQTFSASIPAGTLVWSDEFSRTGGTSAQPNPSTWTYDTGLGAQCCGNHEPETYCAWASTASPCAPTNPNAFVGSDNALHIVALNPAANTYTSARLKSQGLFSFQYGRVEARMMLPESQGMWPAFWLLGNNIATLSWPACGEADIMEHIDGSNPPPSVGTPAPGYDWIAGSIHGGASGSAVVNGGQQYHPSGFSAAAWHTYGMIWTRGQVQYYVDEPSNVYATFNTSNFNGAWPFDKGPMFIILNLAVGGDWPGNPNATTVFPGKMLVDYVRIYTNGSGA